MQKRAASPRPGHGRRAEPKGRDRARQARPLFGLMALIGLGGCIGSPAEGPFEFYRQVTGEALEGRALPPGLDRPTPNFSAIPARPNRTPASDRAYLSTLLAGNRDAAATPRPAGVGTPDPPATEGARVIPLEPPLPPRLASAPAIGPGPATLLIPGGSPVPQIDSAPPPPPSADLLAPPPPNLGAPPPPPRI